MLAHPLPETLPTGELGGPALRAFFRLGAKDGALIADDPDRG